MHLFASFFQQTNEIFQAEFVNVLKTLKTLLIDKEPSLQSPDEMSQNAVMPVLKSEHSSCKHLVQIRTQITDLYNRVTSSLVLASDVKDLLNNLLLQLECEMEFHTFLEPIDGSLHLSKV
jgi:hypothetical protein